MKTITTTTPAIELFNNHTKTVATIIGRNEHEYFVKTSDAIFVYGENEMREIYNLSETQFDKICQTL